MKKDSKAYLSVKNTVIALEPKFQSCLIPKILWHKKIEQDNKMLKIFFFAGLGV